MDASVADTSELVRRGEIPHLVEYKGVLLRPSVANHFQTCLEQWQPLDDDVIIIGYPKCGTNWLQSIVYSLIYFDSERDPLAVSWKNMQNLVPHLDNNDSPTEEEPNGRNGATLVERITERPRIYKLHAPYRILPESIQKHGKVSQNTGLLAGA